MKLRHAPLLLVREMARHATHRGLVADTLARVIQRADELAEFVAIYWKDGRVPLSAQVKKGLAAAFPKFDAYALGEVRSRRTRQAPRRAIPRSRQAAGRSAGRSVEAPDRRRAHHSRHLGSGSEFWRRQARGLGASASRGETRSARSASELAQHARCRCERSSRSRRARINEHRARAAVPFPRCGALRSAVGRGARAGDAQVRFGCRQAAWKDHRAGRCFWLDDRFALSAFRDAAHRRSLWLGGVAARDRGEGGSVQLLRQTGRGSGAQGIRPARRDRGLAAALEHDARSRPWAS